MDYSWESFLSPAFWAVTKSGLFSYSTFWVVWLRLPAGLYFYSLSRIPFSIIHLKIPTKLSKKVRVHKKLLRKKMVNALSYGLH